MAGPSKCGCRCAPERTIAEEASRQHAVELELQKLRIAHAAQVAAEQEARAAAMAALLALPPIADTALESDLEPEFFEAHVDDLRPAGADPCAPRLAGH